MLASLLDGLGLEAFVATALTEKEELALVSELQSPERASPLLWILQVHC